LGNGLFFSISVLTTTYFTEHKESTVYTVCPQMLSFLYLPSSKQNPESRNWLGKNRPNLRNN